MTGEALSPSLQQIGEAAGKVWHALRESGTLSVAKLVEVSGLQRDLAMQGVGWLAREGKLEIEETKRGRLIALK